jgi:hypothetical protein
MLFDMEHKEEVTLAVTPHVNCAIVVEFAGVDVFWCLGKAILAEAFLCYTRMAGFGISCT